MSVHLDGSTVVLEGICRVEDAEPLLRWLQSDPGRIVDLSDVEHLHAAVLQVLMAFRPSLKGPPKDEFLRGWVMPALLDPGSCDMTPETG